MSGTDKLERKLIRDAQNGDLESFCDLGKYHETRLCRQALVLCRDHHLAEDMVQVTLLEAWKSLPRFKYRSRFSTWLYSILIRQVGKSRRTRRLRTEPLNVRNTNVPDARDTSPGNRLILKEDVERLHRAVLELSEPLRETVMLRFFADASHKEISVLLAIPVGTVKSRLHNALNELRKKL